MHASESLLPPPAATATANINRVVDVEERTEKRIQRRCEGGWTADADAAAAVAQLLNDASMLFMHHETYSHAESTCYCYCYWCSYVCVCVYECVTHLIDGSP